MKYKSVLPEGWYGRLLDKADFETSFADLESCTHFYVDAMRGRIRSLQLRVNEAWDYFQNAFSHASQQPSPSVPDLARQFVLGLYIVENALLSGPVDRGAPSPQLRVPDFPKDTLVAYPEIKQAIEMRLSMEGYLRLHLGDYHHAGTIFEGLIQSWTRPPDASLSLHYSSLAAAQHNLGLEAAARTNLENASLALLSGGRLLNRVRAAGVLAGLHTYLEDEAAAQEWRDFLYRMECPKATKDVFMEREKLLLDRCLEQKCLVIL